MLDLPLHEATKNLLSHLKGHVCVTDICKHPLSSPRLQLFPDVWPSTILYNLYLAFYFPGGFLLPWGLPCPSFLAPGKRTRKMLFRNHSCSSLPTSSDEKRKVAINAGGKACSIYSYGINFNHSNTLCFVKSSCWS